MRAHRDYRLLCKECMLTNLAKDDDSVRSWGSESSCKIFDSGNLVAKLLASEPGDLKVTV